MDALEDDLEPDLGKERHPVGVLWEEYKKTRKKKRGSFDFAPHKEKFMEFVNDVVSEEFCYDVNVNKRVTKCTCLHEPAPTDLEKEKLVDCLMNCAIVPSGEQRKLVAEWMRCAEFFPGKRRYLLPGNFKSVCAAAVASFSTVLIAQKPGTADDMV